jgi:hypothetical protein
MATLATNGTLDGARNNARTYSLVALVSIAAFRRDRSKHVVV